MQRMTDYRRPISLSRPFGTRGVSAFCHRTALRLYVVIEIRPLRGC